MAQRRHVLIKTLAQATKGKLALLTAPANGQLQLYGIECGNAATASAVAAIRRMATPTTHIWTQASSVSAAVEATAAVLAGTATDLWVASTNNSGFYVQGTDVFGLIGLQISRAAASGSTLALSYFNGTAWTALTTIEADNLQTAADQYFYFLPPADWVPGVPSGDASAITNNLYTIQILATTAGSGNDARANNFWLGQALKHNSSLAQNTSIEQTYPADFPLMLNGGESLQGYFGTANSGNWVTMRYAIGQ